MTNTVSCFIDSQLPEFIRDENPNFGVFLKAYYKWLELSNNSIGGVVYNTKNLLSYQDIDTAPDQFIQYFINDFLPYFPNNPALDERKLLKIARQFYQKKGTIESIQFLFRALYNKEADVYYPKENILKASADRWNAPQGFILSILTDLLLREYTLTRDTIEI